MTLTDDDRAAQMPTGTLISNAMMVATMTTARVCIVWFHSSIESMSRNAMTVKMGSPGRRVTRNASAARMSVSRYGCGAASTAYTRLPKPSRNAAIPSKRMLRFAVIQSTTAAMPLPMGSRGSSGIVAHLLRRRRDLVRRWMLHRRPGVASSDLLVVLARDRGQDRSARHDADQPPAVVEHGERHDVVAAAF